MCACTEKCIEKLHLLLSRSRHSNASTKMRIGFSGDYFQRILRRCQKCSINADTLKIRNSQIGIARSCAVAMEYIWIGFWASMHGNTTESSTFRTASMQEESAYLTIIFSNSTTICLRQQNLYRVSHHGIWLFHTVYILRNKTPKNNSKKKKRKK